jgi:mannose-6-phosphate isomerase-like protein (cupin superfamily)
MPNFAVKNLMDIEPGGSEGFEIRFARKYLGSEELGVTYERLAPGFVATDGHKHGEQEEAYVVVEGAGAIKLDDERIELKQWDVVRVGPEVVRGLEAGPEGMVLIAVGGRKPEGGDGEIVKDRWPTA